MSAQQESDASPNPSKASTTRPEADGREAAQNDVSIDAGNNPGEVQPKSGLKDFIEWLHPDTPLRESVLTEKFEYWDGHHRDERRPDPGPTWDSLEGWSE